MSTLLKALKDLKRFDIPQNVCDGFAVQKLGYPRFTRNVDIIAPSVALAREKLSLNRFRKLPGSNMPVMDRESKVEIDVLPEGKSVTPGSTPQFVDFHPYTLLRHRL